MKYFLSPLSRAESDALADRFESLIQRRGWGVWAVEEKSSGEFIGFVGLHVPPADFPFLPCVEIAWRLAFRHWGKGFASEAAEAALRTGFERLNLDEIVAYTAIGNDRSRAVMEKIGMRQSEASFEHPSLPATSELREQCLYRMQKREWLEKAPAH